MIRRALSAAALLLYQLNAYGTPMNNPDIKLNPHPRMRYELVVTVEGAPGPFERIEGSVDYEVGNAKCVPMTPIAGATVLPDKHLPIAFIHAGGNTYKADIFADLIQDEDYFGLGICHWSLVGAGANFATKSVDFSPSIYKDDIFAGKHVTRYFANAAYRENAADKRIDIGENSREAFKNPTATFSITIKSMEKLP